MKKIIGSMILSAVMLSATAHAADITLKRDIDNSKFLFDVTAEEGTSVTIDVYAPNKDISDLFDPLRTEPQTDIVKYHNEFYADEDGKIEFNVGINGDSGIYKAYVTVGNETKEISLEYVKKTSNEPLLTSLNNPSTDIQTLIGTGTNRADLGFYLDLYDNVDQSKVAALISEKLPASTHEDAIDAFNEATIIVALAEGDITEISTYADKLAILNDNGRFERRYPLQVAGVDARLSGKTFNTTAAFEAALAEAVVLETIKNPNGHQNIYDVLDEFKAEAGMTALTNLTVVYQQMVGQNYQNFTDMKNAYSGYLASASQPSGGNSGGGGGGGGGGGSSSNSNADSSGLGALIITGEDPKPIEKVYFNDMESSSWAKEAVNYLAKEGIIAGKADGKFCPTDEVSREEFVTIIVNAFNLKKIADFNEFSDVDESDWHYEYVIAAYQNGIISGVGDSVFGTGSKITRQDMATILYRVATSKNVMLNKVNEKQNFNDDSQINDYAKEAVEALQMSGIINGMDGGFFMPKSTATRAQAAQMIYGLLMAK